MRVFRPNVMAEMLQAALALSWCTTETPGEELSGDQGSPTTIRVHQCDGGVLDPLYFSFALFHQK